MTQTASLVERATSSTLACEQPRIHGVNCEHFIESAGAHLTHDEIRLLRLSQTPNPQTGEKE